MTFISLDSLVLNYDIDQKDGLFFFLVIYHILNE